MAFGGKGGYVVAQKSFKKGDVLKIRLGAEGKGTAKLKTDNSGLEADGAIGNDNPAGGWPNGGAGGRRYSNSAPGSGGGGATEVFFAGNRDDASNGLIVFNNEEISRNTGALLLVAGGGGGAGNIAYLRNYYKNRGVIEGGAAGNASPAEGSDITKGLIPALRRGSVDNNANYTIVTTLSEPYTFIKNGEYPKLKQDEDNKYYGEYATEVTYGSTTDGKGITGANGSAAAVWEGSGGGGGGYYGGNAITAISKENSGSGGGGSNYVDTGSGGFTEITNETAAGYGAGKFIIEHISND
jgi:hypothetical protein